MIDKIRRDIQARLEELLGEIDRLRRALAALTSRGSEPASADRVTPADARTASAGEGAAKSSRATTVRTTRTRSASSPAPASAQKPAGSAAAATRTRTARVGPASVEAWGCAMGWGRSVAFSHAQRLEREGWLARYPMLRGHGSLLAATSSGVRMAGVAVSLARPPAPTWWAHL